MARGWNLDQIGANFDCVRLQWGRGGWPADGLADIAERMPTLASMGPRGLARGWSEVQPKKMRRRSASMGPRGLARGWPQGLVGFSRIPMLQWGRGGWPADDDTWDAYDSQVVRCFNGAAGVGPRMTPHRLTLG